MGGAIEIYQNDVSFSGFNLLIENIANNERGTVYATGDSLLNVTGYLTVMSNNALESGGIYLYRSKLNCQLNSSYNQTYS